jgi:hypothetical protein
MKAFFIFAFSLLFVLKSQAQHSFDSLSNKDTIKEYDQTFIANKKGDIGIYFSPFALLDVNPIIYVGLEYFLTDNTSIHTDFGYLPRMQNIYKEKVEDSNRTQSAFLNTNSANFVIKTEFRAYESHKKRHSRYTAFRFTFKKATYDIENDNEYFASRRITTGFSFIRGWQRQFTKQTLLNPYIGIGFKVAFNNPSKNTTKGSTWLDFIPATSLSQKETFPLLDIALGIRFGGKIKRN